MSERPSNQPWKPTAEQLAAFVDGKLDSRSQRSVETWLRRHPDVAAELHDHKRLHRLWERTAPNSPTDRQWAQVHKHIETGLLQAHRPSNSHRPWWVIPLAIGTIAASALLGFVVVRQVWFSDGVRIQSVPDRIVEDSDSRSDQDAVPVESGVLQVLSPDEIDIVSMDLGDSHALVVGTPPVTEPLALLTQDEVTIERVERESNQQKAEFTAEPTPMLWVPARTPER
jgi:hypothetical protein